MADHSVILEVGTPPTGVALPGYGRFLMRKIALVAAAMLALAAAPNSAEARPGGCLKYGLGGAVAGHVAGGHRLKGAALGCLLGIYQRRRHAARARYQDRSRSVDQRRYDDRGPSYGRDRPRNSDRDVTGSTGGFNRGGYFNRNQSSY
jgi:hypothetical protein